MATSRTISKFLNKKRYKRARASNSTICIWRCLSALVAPTLEQQVAEAGVPSPLVECSGSHTAQLCRYSFGLDAGGEHVGFGGRLRTAISSCSTVWFVIIFCMMHQASARQFQDFLRKLRDNVSMPTYPTHYHSS